jgi:UDP-N-acetylmuramoyl-L-alanyl-D-glutamate--2,6-diaminopimelate ligase
MLKFSKIVKTLKALLSDNVALTKDFADKAFSLVSNNSLNITKNGIFVAVRGDLNDGHKYIKNAISAGASLIVYQDPSYSPNKSSEVFFLRVNDSYKAYALLAALQYNFPVNSFDMFAITGTNGKTTCAYLLKFLLEYANYKSCNIGLISTVEYSCGDKKLPADRTTPEALKFQWILNEFIKQDCKATVMEVSSHSLVQNRIGDTNFNFAVFTNLSGDHLDYHLTMEDYFQAKVLLFQNHLKKDGKAVINIDGKYGKRLAGMLTPNQCFSYGFNDDADFKIIIPEEKFNNSLLNFKSNFLISYSGEIYEISIPMPGQFNMANATAVFAVGILAGIPVKCVIDALNNSKQVPGRMESFFLHNGALCFVDYAHTDDALLNVLKELNVIKHNRNGKIYCVFGCGGDRDKTKRSRMGAVANEFADISIITSDNPRNENPLNIMKDIISGFDEHCVYKQIQDRELAIKFALEKAEPSDIILIAGKGHENYQEINGEKIPFDDRLIIENFINDK